MSWLRNWAAFGACALYCACLVVMDVVLLARGALWGAALGALLMDCGISALLLPPVFYLTFARQRQNDAAAEMVTGMEVMAGVAFWGGLLAQSTFSMVVAINAHDPGALWLVRGTLGCMPFVALVTGPFVVGAVLGLAYLGRYLWVKREMCALFWADACAAACCPGRAADHVELVECGADAA